MSKQLLLSVFTGALLSACATHSTALTPTQTLSLPSVSVPSEWHGNKVQGESVSSHIGWLNGFNNTALDDLVLRALEDNPNLKQVEARLNKAKAQTNRAKSALYPELNATLGGTRTDNFETSKNASASLNAGLNVSWEPDLWGRLKASSIASENFAQAAKADYEAAQHVLAASVVENYFLAIEAQRLAEVSQSNLTALNKTLGFVTVQYERGLRSGQDISLIRADVASAKVSLNRSEGAARAALRALNILLGAYPQTEQGLDKTLPVTPAFTALGKPVDILTQRPDVQAAKFRVHAAYASHKVTKKAQKPNLSLNGVIGGNSSDLASLFDPASLATTLIANLTTPIFDAGSRKADIAIAQADIDESLAAYKETALTAFRDVERQIDQGDILLKQEVELTQALSDARDALRFTQFKYESGDSDLLNVLSVQQRVSFIEAQLVSTRRARLVQYVNLALALGLDPKRET